jgi:hypothetical protein
MFELIGGKRGIFAVPFRNRRPLKPIVLPDGAIVEAPSPEQRRQAPVGIDANLGVDPRGKPVPLDVHWADDDSVVYIGLHGVFLLPTGQVAAVYGCRAEEIVPPASM